MGALDRLAMLFSHYQRSSEAMDLYIRASNRLLHISNSTGIVNGRISTTRRRLLDYSFDHRIPSFNHPVDILHLAKKLPGLFNICIILVCHDPAAILAIFYGRKEEMYIWSDPALECITILAKLSSSGISDHVRVWKPCTKYSISTWLLNVSIEHAKERQYQPLGGQHSLRRAFLLLI